jgi:hypothetical protein
MFTSFLFPPALVSPGRNLDERERQTNGVAVIQIILHRCLAALAPHLDRIGELLSLLSRRRDRVHPTSRLLERYLSVNLSTDDAQEEKQR